jgi:ribonuclease BN (tRNA processing enzyme)
MDLTIIGCSAGMPLRGHPSAGYLVDTGSTRLLLDCGPGVATALSAVVSPDTLDAVLLSHAHIDHCYDVLPLGRSILRLGMRYPAAGVAPQTEMDSPAIPLYVPGGTTPMLRQLASLFPVTTAPVLDRVFELAFDVREYTPGDTFTVGDAEIHLEPLVHAVPNCGIRIKSGTGSLAYTGDTGRTPALRTLADGVDLLLAECTLTEPDTGPHGHLCAADSAEVAEAAGVGQLVLTHFGSVDPAWLAASRQRAADRFAGPVRLASPQARFPVREVSP